LLTLLAWGSVMKNGILFRGLMSKAIFLKSGLIINPGFFVEVSNIFPVILCRKQSVRNLNIDPTFFLAPVPACHSARAGR
jgi:hypothetical protein